MPHTHDEEIRVVIFRDAEMWAAQCLEYDIGTQAATLSELHTRLELTLRAELKESIERRGEAFTGIDPAPARYHQMWENDPLRVQRKETKQQQEDLPSPAVILALCA